MKNKKSLFMGLAATCLLAFTSCGAKAISVDEFCTAYDNAIKQRGNKTYTKVTFKGKSVTLGKTSELYTEDADLMHNQGIYSVLTMPIGFDSVEQMKQNYLSSTGAEYSYSSDLSFTAKVKSGESELVTKVNFNSEGMATYLNMQTDANNYIELSYSNYK